MVSSHRQRQRLIGATTLGLIALLVFALPASAGRRWCARDPIVGLNGTAVQIWVSVPEEYLPAVNGAVVVKVQTPSNIKRDVIFVDEGFNGYGETVKFTTLNAGQVYGDGSFDVQINASIPIDFDTFRALGGKGKSMPLQITVTTHGELLNPEGGKMTMTGGETWAVEGTNQGTKVKLRVKSTS